MATPTAKRIETDAARWERIANQRLNTLCHTESTIDDQGRLITAQDAEIKRLDKVIDQKDSLIESLRREIGRLETRLKERG